MVRFAAALGSVWLGLSASPEALASARPANVPFTPCGGMICMPVTLADGKDHLLLLDTGNASSWLTSAVARSLGLQLDPIAQSGKVVPGIFRLGEQSVSLRGRVLSGRFLAFDAEQTGELPANVEGALAYTLFMDHVLEIDYPHRTIRLLDVSSQGSPSSGSSMQLITFGKAGPPIVVGSGFSVGGKALRAQIDTCYTGTLLIYDRAIADLGLQGRAAKGRPKYFPYTDGGVNMNEATAGSVAFGSDVLSRRPATIYFSGTGKNPVHQPDGLFEATAGNALFAHSIVTLNFHAMRVKVQPG